MDLSEKIEQRRREREAKGLADAVEKLVANQGERLSFVKKVTNLELARQNFRKATKEEQDLLVNCALDTINQPDFQNHESSFALTDEEARNLISAAVGFKLTWIARASIICGPLFGILVGIVFSGVSGIIIAFGGLFLGVFLFSSYSKKTEEEIIKVHRRKFQEFNQ